MKYLLYTAILVVAFCSVQGMEIFVALMCQFVLLYLKKFMEHNIKQIFEG